LALLADQLAAGVVDASVRGTRITPFGVLYDIVVLVDGLSGATVPVATIWLVQGATATAHLDLGRHSVSAWQTLF
jgi:hypothetical protein